MKHTNVALFVPHEGCPNQCSFCNQRSISGSTKRLNVKDIDEAVATALKTQAQGREIAFFGGSFTAIEREYMISLLRTAAKYIDNRSFTGIRISTRPDAVDEEICEILKKYKVSAVELGAQSMDDEVLSLNNRGHTAGDVVRASRLLKALGFELGLQMMTGLYGSDDNESIETARKIIELSPDTVRIYPTVVLRGTELARLYESGEYKPQTTEQAVKICSVVLEMFHEANIPVIRLGLHSGGNVMSGYVAGAFHPSLGELCKGEIYLRRARQALMQAGIEKGKVKLFVKPEAISQMTGQKRRNIEALKAEGYDCRVLPRDGLAEYEVIM
ncbi:MAG: radical SAM protein [Clostridiales bacterium]|nr:radical SAM protein [Clostridiales bacterium]